MTGLTETGPARLSAMRWSELGGTCPITTGHTLFITNIRKSFLADECQRKGFLKRVTELNQQQVKVGIE